MNLCYCYAIISGLMGSWLYEKILGYDLPERLNENIVQCFLQVYCNGRSSYKFLGCFWRVKYSGPFIFSIRRLPERNPRKLKGEHSWAGFPGHCRPLLLLLLKDLKASVTYWPWDIPLRNPTNLVSRLPLEWQPGMTTLNCQLAGHSICASPHKFLFLITFAATDKRLSRGPPAVPYTCSLVSAAVGGWAYGTGQSLWYRQRSSL